MTTLFSTLIVTCFALVSLGQQHHPVNPVGIETLKDDTIRSECMAIRNLMLDTGQKTKYSLTQYNRLKRYENLVELRYKANGWRFSINFNSAIGNFKRDDNTTILDINTGERPLGSIRLFHVKAMTAIDSSALEIVNELLSGYLKQKTRLLLASFISSDFMRTYLVIRSPGAQQPFTMIFVFKRFVFYGCYLDNY